MAKKKVMAVVKIQIPAGQATPAPPVGTALGPNGVAINPRTADTELMRSCLETDLTTLNNYNWKVTLVPFNNNRFNFQNTWAEKVRNARDAGDLRPIETTYRQKAVSSQFGRAGWLTGPSPFWKAADQHVISDRWLVDVMWSHLGNNFVLDFHEDELADVQGRSVEPPE